MSKFNRSMGFWGAFSTATGLVVAGTTMVSLGNSMGLVGPVFVVAAFIAMIVSMLVSFSYAELSSFIPGAGMVGDYTLVAMGRFMAIVVVLSGYMVLVSSAGALESITAGLATEILFPNFNGTIAAIGLLILFLIINLIGIHVFSAVQIIVTCSLMVMTTVMGLFGLFEIGTINETVDTVFNPNGWSFVFQSIALGIWLFIGIEYVAPMAEEIKNPSKNIPKAMIFGLLTIFVADALFGLAITRYVPLDTLSQVESPQVEGATAMFGEIGLILMVLITIIASASSINSHLAAVPRMLYGLGREGLLPKIFTYLHPKFRTPWAGILFVFALLCIPFLLSINIELITTLISVASVTWLMSYIITQLDVIILRKRYPKAKRPFKTPFYPAPQIIGIIACAYMIMTITPETTKKLQIYSIAGTIIAVIVLYAWVWLKVKKLSMFTPVPLEQITSDFNDEMGTETLERRVL
ncbi:APC family permease [Niallia sp. Krafla_26]|uniref:APC family permease n=1 Tax=Niallia sp. Krafla_26 TaxID=3064703 RepID=UPI003D17B3F9